MHDVRGLQAEFDVPVLGEISRISRARIGRTTMSRIQDILSKAERDGSVRHSHGGGDYQRRAADAPADDRSAPCARDGCDRRPTRDARPLPESLREAVSSGYDPLLVAAVAHAFADRRTDTGRCARGSCCSKRDAPGACCW